jgi:hypothetical protein
VRGLFPFWEPSLSVFLFIATAVSIFALSN